MTAAKRPHKIIKPFYGKAEGYDHNNAIVALWKD